MWLLTVWKSEDKTVRKGIIDKGNDKPTIMHNNTRFPGLPREVSLHDRIPHFFLGFYAIFDKDVRRYMKKRGSFQVFCLQMMIFLPITLGGLL